MAILRIPVLVLLLQGLVSLPGHADNDDAAWQWPSTTKFGATASFGEYRGLRFHMGLDFSTGGVEGEPVKPALSGTVEKVRAQRRGYGRVIYLRHPNGYQTVYAHLAQFGPKVAEAIRAKGSDPDAYFGTLNLDVAVTAEDLIAYTGESGAGLPHLHFEVRAAGNQPIDPLSLPFPPLETNGGQAEVDGLIVVPLDHAARVNGSVMPFQISGSSATIQASGKVGLQVLASIHGARSSRLGVRGIRVQADGRELGSWLPRRISFDDYRKAGLVFDQAASGFGPTNYAYCFDNRASFLPWVDDYASTAPLTVSDPITLTVSVMSMDGNWRKFLFQLSPSAPVLAAEPSVFSGTHPGLQSTSLKTALVGSRVLVKSQGTSGRLVVPDRIIGLASDESHLYAATGHDPFDLIWRTSAGSLKRPLLLLPAQQTFTAKLGGWQLRAEGIPNLPPTAVMLAPPNHRHQSDDLLFDSQVLRFGRPGLPSQGLTAAFNAGDRENPRQLGIYAWSEVKQAWRFWGGAGKSGPRADVDYLTDLVVARDVHQPRVLRPKFHDYFTGRRVVIPIGDVGSGIAADSVKVFKGGRPVAGEYDRDRRWIIMPEGAVGPWTVTAADRAGNTVQVKGLRP